jgi:hypothetical protein
MSETPSRAEAIEKAIQDEFGDGYAYGWVETPETGKFTVTPKGSFEIELEVIEHVTEYEFSDSYSEYPAKDTRIVLKDELGSYFLKTGRYESFIGSDWSIPLREVTPTTKTIIVYE